MYRALPQSPTATVPSRKEPIVCANIALSAFAVPRDSSLTLKNDNVGRRFAYLSYFCIKRTPSPTETAFHFALIYCKANAENVSKVTFIWSGSSWTSTPTKSD